MENPTAVNEGSSSSACSVIWQVDAEKVFKVKSPCPYCGAEITAGANAWEEDDDGLWCATDIEIWCASEPDLDDEEEWDAWNIEHGRGDDNEAWHHLHERIVRSMKEKVRFNLQNAKGEAQPSAKRL